MGFLKKLGGKLGGAVAGLINPTVALGSALEGGIGMIAGKYGSDLQGHENDKMREYNLNMSREMFDKQVLENQRAFGANVEETKRAFAANQAESDRQRGLNVAREDQVWEREKAYNMDLWAKQNEYNSPAAQMQRLTDAGLNPNLMYGQGTTGIATAIPASRVSPSGGEGSRMEGASMESARANVPDGGRANPRGEYLMSALANYTSIRNANLMAQNLHAQRDYVEAQTENVVAAQEGIKADNKVKREAAKAAARENKLLEGTGTSSRDSSGVRVGGRILKWLRNLKTGIQSSIADEAEKTKPFFHND